MVLHRDEARPQTEEVPSGRVEPCATPWYVPEGNPELERAIRAELRCSEILARLLCNRAVRSVREAASFLTVRLTDLVPPEAFSQIPQAIERIREALRTEQKIAIFGDYDVDGITAAAVVYLFLRDLGAFVKVFLPDRVEEGYGLSRNAVDRMHHWGAQLVLTVDNGTAAQEEIAYGRSLGMDFIVTDHHEGPERLPPEVPVLNPKLPQESYPFRDLAGAGVAFKLVWGLAKTLSGQKKVSESFRRFLWEAVGFAGLGTLADVVPLVGENRIFAHFGLKIIAETKRPGLAELRRATCRREEVLKAHHVAFRLAPPLNAAGRLGAAERAFQLIVTEDPAQARELVSELQSENNKRRQVEQEIFHQAQLLAEEPLRRGDPCLVLAHPQWHVGVLGVAAARLAEYARRPVILLAVEDGLGRGSGRSFGGISLYDAVASVREHLIEFGGHSEACGLRLQADRIGPFREALCRHVVRLLAGGPPPFRADMVLAPRFITMHVLSEIERLAPFGPGNERPLFIAEEVELIGPPRSMGSQGEHLSFFCRSGSQTFRCVYFGGASERKHIGETATFAYQPALNAYMGVEEIELRVKRVF